MAYKDPKPAGIAADAVQRRGAGRNTNPGESILTCEAARLTGYLRRAILNFLESTYHAGVLRQGWDRDLVSRV